MGTSAVVQLCFRLTLLLVLSNAAVLTPDDESDPDHVCPCKEETTCPRIWGSQQYDSLLGNFKPCIEPGFVRCCGVRTHESNERSDEDSEEKSDVNYAKPQRDPARVIPPGIVVPVPFQFPEYLDYRTSTTTTTTTTTTIEPPSSSVNEAEGDGDDDEGSIEGDVEGDSGEWVYSDEYPEEDDSTPAPIETGSLSGLKPGLDKEELSENIDQSTTSQPDNLVSSKPLDYPSVDDTTTTERDPGTNTVSTGIESEVDSSKDSKKNEVIVNDEKTKPDINPELQKSGENIDEDEDTSEFTVSKEFETETPKSLEADKDLKEEGDLELSTEVIDSVTSLPDYSVSKEETEKETNESTKKEPSKIEREVSSNSKNPADVDKNGEAVVGTVENIPETNKDKNNIIPSTESAKIEITTPSSNLMNILTGDLSSNLGTNSKLENNNDNNNNFNGFPPWMAEYMKEINRVQDIGVWHIANRSYIPVLINAGFLKDRPTATGQIGLDPLSGVTHSDIADPELAPELLPLSCGNVVFGERFRNGKTLVCEIPQANESPVRFLQEEVSPVSQEKLRGPSLPGAFLPAGVLTSSDGLDSTKLLPTTTTTVTNGKEINSRRPVRKRIVIKRPVPLAPTKDQILEKEATTTTSKPAQNLTDRNPEIIDNDPDTQKQDDGSPAVIEPSFETESKNPNDVSIPVSVSPSTTSEEPEVSSPNTPVETSNSEAELAAELAKADQAAKDLLSKFYILPLAPVLPPKPNKGSRNSTSRRPRPKPPAFLTVAEPEKVVETVSEEPTTTATPVTLPSEPTKVVEVVDERPTTIIPAVSLPTEPAKVVDEVTEAPRRRTRVGKKRQRSTSGKKVTSGDANKVSSGRTTRDLDSKIVGIENSEAAKDSLKRNTRQVKNYGPNSPSLERKVISADQISPAGSPSIIGPIPKRFPELKPERKDSPIELPKPNSGTINFRPGDRSRLLSGIGGSETRRDNTFKPSPVDPIKWN